MSGRTREANQARLVRCSAACGRLCWLAGALPVAADPEYVCKSCTELHEATASLPTCGAVDEVTGAVCSERGLHRRHMGDEVTWTGAAP